MQGLSSKSVVDQMVTELAERRQNRIGKRVAYRALALAILSADDLQVSETHEWESRREAALAA